MPMTSQGVFHMINLRVPKGIGQLASFQDWFTFVGSSFQFVRSRADELIIGCSVFTNGEQSFVIVGNDISHKIKSEVVLSRMHYCY